MTSVTLIDNYDSFTWNLWHYFGQLGCDVTVRRNDAVTADEVLAADPDAIVLSPGPCTPNEAGICCDLVAKADGRVPIFGVCLGHQAIGQVMGGDVVRAPTPMHGKLSDIHHEGGGVFRGINGPFKATRYHSLIVERETLSDVLELVAWTPEGEIMGLKHRDHETWGVQFHPESVLTRPGLKLIENFLTLCRQHRSVLR